MIESPLLEELFMELYSERFQNIVLQVLATRFGEVPPDLATALKPIHDENQLNELHRWAVQCQDLDAFRSRLPS